MSRSKISLYHFSEIRPFSIPDVQEYEFAEIQQLIDDFGRLEGPQQKEALKRLILYMNNNIGFQIEINKLTNFKSIVVELLEYVVDNELKEYLEIVKRMLDQHQVVIPPDAISLLEHFRPIFLKENRLSRLENSNIVKSRDSFWHICPFDPVITVPQARIRTFNIDTIKRKPVQKEKLIHQFTDEAGIVYCELIFSNAMLDKTNAMRFRIGILDADLPMTDSGTFVAGKDKGGISFDNSGTIWINGHWNDATDPKDQWERGMHIAMEVNMNIVPRTLRFFIEGRQIARFVTNIPERICFFATPCMQYDSFHVQSIYKLNQPKGQLHETDQELHANDDLYDYTQGMENED
ncbi:MAG: hypothetical protein EZS28_027178 [Streblomastix strix]|uniref:SPRY domain-containing protein n=1 Tax=Streblomastix strix TaxID=222440 RepID=A0A5J4V3H2_9EUKA|nr:MAG: hypothetical protein EZS28_027178 [Streblomastix strix]